MKIFSREKKNGHIVYRLLGIKLTKRVEIADYDYRISKLESEIIRNSGLWDARWYIQNYHPDMTKSEALSYYMREGYKKKESPSPLLDASKYSGTRDVEPILDYILRGRYVFERLFFENKYPPVGSVPQTAGENASKVVYTCITGNYDNIENIKFYHYTDPDWHYVCFTDNQEWISRKQIGIWTIRPLAFDELDNARNNRWHKIHPHKLFPQANISIYIDSNINIITSKLFQTVNECGKDILLPIHSDRVDVYKELQWAKEMNFDNPQKVDEQYQIIKSSGFPENYGLFENNVIYRKHHQKEIIEMMEEWWHFIKNYSQRDQTSLAFIFWKHGRKIEDYMFENTRIDYQNYCVFAHQKQYVTQDNEK